VASFDAEWMMGHVFPDISFGFKQQNVLEDAGTGVIILPTPAMH